MNSNKDNHEDERKIAASSDSDLVNSSADDEDDSKYQYRDFSRVQPDEGESVLDVIAHMPSSTGTGPGNSGMGSSAHAIKHQKLPIKLNAMLSDKELAHIISWMPHGRSWRILKPKQFVKEVLPKYFDYCNYNSFIRLVNAWGFRRFSSGPDRHSYYHELFLRGLPYLHSRMRRVTGKDKKPPVDQDDEPDLYEVSRLNPLPEADGSITPAPATSTQVAAPAQASSSTAPPVTKTAPVKVQVPHAAVASTSSPVQNQTQWQCAIQNAALANSYAAAIAAQMQQRQPTATQPQSRLATSAWPYSEYQGLSQFNSFMGTQNMSPPSEPSPPPSQYTAASQRLSMQQLFQHLDASRLQQMLQGAMLNQSSQCHPAASAKSSTNSADLSMLTHGHGPKNARGESPIMYIPVYPSTLASLTGQNSQQPPSDLI